jgi:hypothetical protein
MFSGWKCYVMDLFSGWKCYLGCPEKNAFQPTAKQAA